MSGKIESGQQVTVTPAADPIEAGDIVLAHVAGKDYLHLVKAVGQDGRYQIGNNHGGINGWTPRHHIYGKVVKVEP